MQQGEQTLTWDSLLAAEPALLDFERAAIEAAANKWWAWPRWFPMFRGFNDLVGVHAQCEALRSDAARQVAVAHLIGTFQAEWARRTADRTPPNCATRALVAAKLTGRLETRPGVKTHTATPSGTTRRFPPTG